MALVPTVKRMGLRMCDRLNKIDSRLAYRRSYHIGDVQRSIPNRTAEVSKRYGSALKSAFENVVHFKGDVGVNCVRAIELTDYV